MQNVFPIPSEDQPWGCPRQEAVELSRKPWLQTCRGASGWPRAQQDVTVVVSAGSDQTPHCAQRGCPYPPHTHLTRSSPPCVVSPARRRKGCPLQGASPFPFPLPLADLVPSWTWASPASQAGWSLLTSDCTPST